jgi:uncharacterized protein (TIGR02453 family)
MGIVSDFDASPQSHGSSGKIEMDLPRLSAYLRGLSENNQKAWFEANRAEFQALRDQFTVLVGDVIAGIAEWDDRVRWVDPRDCIFRIYRDVRFSNDKTPYKTQFSAAIGERGRKDGSPGYYLEIDHTGAMFLAGGVYLPEPERLGRIRELVAEHPEKLRKVLRKRGFKQTFGELWGERLKRPPRGFAPDHPLIETIKLKSFMLVREREVSAETGDVRPWMAETFRAMHPFILWLMEAEEGAEPPSG